MCYCLLQNGHLSCTGECFDVGKTVSMALHKFGRSKETDPFPGSTAKTAAGNGSLMRLCPVPLLYRNNPAIAIAISGESSRTTHGADAALDACRCEHIHKLLCYVMILGLHPPNSRSCL